MTRRLRLEWPESEGRRVALTSPGTMLAPRETRCLRAPSLPGSLGDESRTRRRTSTPGQTLVSDRPAEHAGSAGNKHRCHDSLFRRMA